MKFDYPEQVWRRLTEEDIPQLLEFCLENPDYYRYLNETPSAENLRTSMFALPPRATTEQKHFYGFFYNGRLTAVLDLITRWPKDDTAFIGWLMVAGHLHRRGMGTLLYSVIEEQLRERGFTHIRLGCIEANIPAQHFWRKCGFLPTGAVSKEEHYDVHIFEKDISAAD